MVQLALFQPDIPHNTGTLFRLCACLDIPLHIIEPAGFRLDKRALKRAGMDYLEHCNWTKHAHWDSFYQWSQTESYKLILGTTKSSKNYIKVDYNKNDILLLGRESSGVPDDVHQICDERITIPMKHNMRSLNVAISGAMILGEMIRQTDESRM